MKEGCFANARRLCAVALSLLLLLGASACNGKMPGKNPLDHFAKDAPGISAPLRCDAAIHYAVFEGRARLESESREMFSLLFSEPTGIGGFTVTMENGVCRYGIDGIFVEHKQGTLPAPDAALLLFLPIQAVMRGEHKRVTAEENVWIYEGVAADCVFFVKQSSETGEIMSVSVPQKDFEALLLPATV